MQAIARDDLPEYRMDCPVQLPDFLFVRSVFIISSSVIAVFVFRMAVSVLLQSPWQTVSLFVASKTVQSHSLSMIDIDKD
jgi:hypothetical protein